jgi:hypothetical protein
MSSFVFLAVVSSFSTIHCIAGPLPPNTAPLLHSAFLTATPYSDPNYVPIAAFTNRVSALNLRIYNAASRAVPARGPELELPHKKRIRDADPDPHELLKD